MKLLPILAAMLVLTGCATFEKRDDAIYVGDTEDAVYDPRPVSDWMKECLAQQKQNPGQICVEGVDISADRLDPVTVIGEKGDQYRFTVYWGWHGGRSGWVKKSDIAFEDDFKPVRDWTHQSHWNLCDDDGCMVFDIATNGHFAASYTASCTNKNSEGKCPEYCPFTQNYDSPHCYDSGQVTVYGDIYRLKHKSWIVTYLLTVEGQGICWSEAWLKFNSCQGPISWVTKK